MLRHVVFAVLCGTPAFALMSETASAACPSARELELLKQQREAYRRLKPQYCADPRTKTVCQQITAFIAYVDQIEKQCGGTKPPKPGESDCDKTRRIIRENSEAGRKFALDYVQRNRPGRNGGFVLYYSRPPIYCGQTEYTPVPRPYYVKFKTGEAVRVINQLSNNGNKITRISPW